MKIRRIMVAVDFSACSHQAVDYACKLAADVGAKIVLVHAMEPFYLGASSLGPYADYPILVQEQRDHAKKAMHDLTKKLEQKRVPLDKPLVIAGSAAHVIPDQAERRNIDMIVMGTHGRTGFSHMLLGSVAERIVRTAPCAVLTIREKGPVKK